MSPHLGNDDAQDFSSASDDDEDGLGHDLEALRQACLRTGADIDDLDGGKTNDNGPPPFAGDDGNPSGFATSAISDGEEDDLELVRKLQNRFSISADIFEPVSMQPICALLPVSDDDSEDDDFETLCAVRRRFAAFDNSGTKSFMRESVKVPAPSGIGLVMEISNDSLVDRTDAYEEAPNLLSDKAETHHHGSTEQHQSEACKLLTLKYSSFPKSAQVFIDAIKKNRSCQKFIRTKLAQIETRIEENKKMQRRVKILRDFQVSCNRITGRALSQGKDLRIQLISEQTSQVADRKVSAMQTGPVENSHVANYKRALAMFPISLKPKNWQDVEKENLQKGIEQQYQELVLQYSMDKLSGSEGSPGDVKSLDIIISSVRDLEITAEKLREFLPKVNWDKLATLFVTGRSGAECRAQWYNFGDPLINNSCWTEQEELKLLSIVQKNGVYNWPHIAVSLGTNRTPFQCLKRYQRSLNFCMLNQEWSKEEDAKLCAAVEKFGLSNWQSVASALDQRTGPQCSNRWRKSLDPNRPRKGRWTADESKCLKIAVKIFGPKNWKKIAQFVPGRTDVRCRERWVNCLDPSLNFCEWTEEEDSKLEAAVEENGFCWAKIAKCLPRRTDNSCMRRWMKLHRDQVPLLQAARKIKKAALISNFVDRESERPTLGPNNFLPSPVIESISSSKHLHEPRKLKRKSRGGPETEKENDATLINALKKIKSQKSSNKVQISSEESQAISNGANDENVGGNHVLTKRRLKPSSEKYLDAVSARDNSSNCISSSSMTTSFRELNTRKKKKNPDSRVKANEIVKTNGSNSKGLLFPAGNSESGLNADDFETNAGNGSAAYSKRFANLGEEDYILPGNSNNETDVIHDQLINCENGQHHQPSASCKETLSKLHSKRKIGKELGKVIYVPVHLPDSGELLVTHAEDVEKSSLIRPTKKNKAPKQNQTEKRCAEPSGKSNYVASVPRKQYTSKKSKPGVKSDSKQVLEMDDDENVTLASFLRGKSNKSRKGAKNADQAYSLNRETRSKLVKKGTHEIGNGNKLSTLPDAVQMNDVNRIGDNLLSCEINSMDIQTAISSGKEEPSTAGTLESTLFTRKEPLMEQVSIHQECDLDNDDMALVSFLHNKTMVRCQFPTERGMHGKVIRITSKQVNQCCNPETRTL